MSEHNPSLRVNVAALGVLQIANYLIPLITLPYLTRVLGIEAFGKVAFVQVVMQFCILLTDYGFSWSATSQIAANRTDRSFVSRTFMATWTAQWLLVLLALLILTICTMTVPLLKQDASLYLLGFLLIIGNVLFPMWLLQGLERLKEAAVIQLSSRLVTLPLLFILVTSPADTQMAVLIIGLAPTTSGIVSLFWINRVRLLDWQLPDWQDIAASIKAGGGLFMSKISISLYTQLIPLLVGVIAGQTAIGYFSLADRARRAVQSLLLPLSQAMFPRMSHLFSSNPDKANDMLKISYQLTLLVSVSASLGLWFGADLIILLLGGEGYEPAADVLRWMAFIPVVVGLSNIFGTQIMIPNKMTSAFNWILAACALLGLVIVGPLVLSLAEIGGAIALLITEASVTLLMLLVLIKKGFFKSRSGAR